MASGQLRRALISMYDKTGLEAFAQRLVREQGSELISTGGTAGALQAAGLDVTLVEDLTGFPEILNGRVKTLHPRVHAGLLADLDEATHRDTLKAQQIEPFDMVVVSLYPFSETIAQPKTTFADGVEMIDIGGPSMLRAAAKNHRHVWAAANLAGAARVLDALRDGADEATLEQLRRTLAAEVFAATARYDAAVADYVAQQANAETDAAFAARREIALERMFSPRYGENPHQRAAMYRVAATGGFVDALAAEAERLSYNNVVDAAAAYELCRELHVGFGGKPAACFIKHTNACGAAVAPEAGGAAREDAYRRAYLGDPNAAMGGILAVNFPVDAAFAETVMGTLQKFGADADGCKHPPRAFFVEVLVAPAFDEAAVGVIRERKAWGARVRLLAVGEFGAAQGARFKHVPGGMLVQDADGLGLNEDDWRTASRRSASTQELEDLRLAWLVCKHTKSNAITIAKDGMLIGSGAGQMSRVMSCRLATWLAEENGHAARLGGSAAASDAFFPFADGPGLLAEAGVRAVIQPGGSKRDGETVALCDERGLALVLTGTRHFLH